MRYLVRHADAGDKLHWSGPDEQRPLSDVGRREADGLVSLLARFPIARIVSSPAVRCRQTVEPLANHRQLQLSLDSALAVGADVDRVVELLVHPDAEGVAWCSHRELIAPLIIKLRGRGAPIGDDVAWSKGSVWVFDPADGSIASAMYLPPVDGERSVGNRRLEAFFRVDAEGTLGACPIDELLVALPDAVVDKGGGQLIDPLVTEALGPEDRTRAVGKLAGRVVCALHTGNSSLSDDPVRVSGVTRPR